MNSNQSAAGKLIIDEEKSKGKSTKDKIRNTLTDELVFGICAPIGSLREPVIDLIEKILRDDYKYDVQRIKLSDYIKLHQPTIGEIRPGETKDFTFLMNKIKGGDTLRENYGKSVLAELAINDIHLSRHENNGKPEFTVVELLKSRRRCFIIDSLKNKEELELLKDVYKDIFYFFSIFSPMNERRESLSIKGLSKTEIDSIIDRDSFENNSHGQNVRETFVSGDFFIRVSKSTLDTIEQKIQRYLNIIFESDVVTPNFYEVAMYEAKSASGNSACLSRQVGAAITCENGEIISRGWNDVPKFGGNLYKEGDAIDNRCKFNGYCSNDRTKDLVTTEIIDAISDDSGLQEIFKENNAEFNFKINEKIRTIIRKSTRIKDLIEFSRAVHAEMHAIIIGSQLAGNKMVGGKLFCTTYPCHNCARHLIVAGIKEIYYIEPYTKSLSLALHNDAITENESDTDKVKLLVYDGVAPSRYLEFFSMKRPRKDKDGKLNLEFKEQFNPKSRLSLQALPTLEQQAIHSLYERGLLTE